MLFLNIVAIQLAWLACLGIYSGARQQVLLAKPLSKPLSWGVFVFASLLSIVLFGQIYHLLEAIIFWLVVIMLGWVVVALAAPYFNKAWRLIPIMSGCFLLIGFMGLDHVG